MENRFSALGFDVTLEIDPEAVETAWRERTRAHSGAETSSPDSAPPGAESPDLIRLHEARAVLTDPARRLAHWLELAGVAPERASGMDSDLVDLFAHVDGAIKKTDAFLARHREADSRLARALLTKDSISVQSQIQETMQRLRAEIDRIIERFPNFDSAGREGDHEEATRSLQRLRFLGKWEQQCRERLLSLIEI